MSAPVLYNSDVTSLRALAAPLRDLLVDVPLHGADVVCSDPGHIGSSVPAFDVTFPQLAHGSTPVCACVANHPLLEAIERWHPLVEVNRELDKADSLLSLGGHPKTRHPAASRYLLTALVRLDSRAMLDLAAADPWAAATAHDLRTRREQLRELMARRWRSGPKWGSGPDQWARIRALDTVRGIAGSEPGLALRRAAVSWPVVRVDPEGRWMVVRAPSEQQPWEDNVERAHLFTRLTPVEGGVPLVAWQIFEHLSTRALDTQEALDASVRAARELPTRQHPTLLRMIDTGLSPHDAVTATAGISTAA